MKNMLILIISLLLFSCQQEQLPVPTTTPEIADDPCDPIGLHCKQVCTWHLCAREMPGSIQIKNLPGFQNLIQNWEQANAEIDREHWILLQCETIELSQLRDSCDLIRYQEQKLKNYQNRRNNLIQYHGDDLLQLFLNDYFYQHGAAYPCEENT